jgi:hypothetical protein
MADNVENVSGIGAMGARATRAMNGNGQPVMTGLRLPGKTNTKIPMLIDPTNKHASNVKEKRALANSAKGNMPGSTINIAYDLKEDMDAIEEERRYRAAVTFLEWIIATYDGDSFSTHVMFEKHPILKEMLTKSIDHWIGLVRKFAIAKILPRTMWDADVEDALFSVYSMSLDERVKFIEFISSNPFFTQNYQRKDPLVRGPFSIRKILNGVPDAVRAYPDAQDRATGGSVDGTRVPLNSLFGLLNLGAGDDA